MSNTSICHVEHFQLSNATACLENLTITRTRLALLPAAWVEKCKKVRLTSHSSNRRTISSYVDRVLIASCPTHY